MADKKISALTGAATPLAGTEVLPIVQGGATVKVSAANITAGRAVSMASLSAVGSGAGGTQTLATFNAAADAFSNSVELALEPLISGQTSTCIGAQREGVGTGAAVYLKAGGNEVLRGSVAGDITVSAGNLVFGTAAKGITTTVANGDVTVTPLGTGKTVLAKNGLRIPNNAAITVGTGATQISVNAISWSGLAFVFGVDGGGNAFSDLVFYADGTTVALASRTVSASPAARTYTAPSGQLNLAMGSGSYSVFFQHIWLA